MHREDDLIDTTEMYRRVMVSSTKTASSRCARGSPAARAVLPHRVPRRWPGWSATASSASPPARRIELTPEGRSAAIRVMRKHRLAECLLADVLGLDWQLVHDEACRWEHVMSEAVERRVLDILGHPAQSPTGTRFRELANSAMTRPVPLRRTRSP